MGLAKVTVSQLDKATQNKVMNKQRKILNGLSVHYRAVSENMQDYQTTENNNGPLMASPLKGSRP